MTLKLKVAVLGRKPTHCTVAAKQLLKPGIELEDRYRTISEVVQAVSNGEMAWGVVPLRNNSIAGKVITDTRLAFEAHPGTIVIARHFLPIRHALLARRGATLKEISVVASKAQALEQCREWLNANLPRATLTEVDSTSAGLQLALDDRFTAIIGSAELTSYGLSLLAENAQDNPNNETEFGVIVRADGQVELLKEYLADEIRN